ncbi:MAG: hypothetical protein WCS65_04510 [Verrucomicrobiae bacterium]
MGNDYKQPAARDYESEMRMMTQYAQAFAAAQAEQQLKTNQGMIDQSLAATGKIAGTLGDSPYTKSALARLDAAGTNYDAMAPQAQQMALLGGQAVGDVGGTEIERQLESQALSDLAIGRSLSPEQERAAQQSARAGFAARGMATGTPSAVAEILNRDVYAQNRLDSRRAFAGSVNQAQTQNRISRLGTAGNLLGQTAGVYQNMGAGQQSLAQSYVGADPYQRALGSNIPIASQGASASMTSSAFGQMAQYGSDLFNTNYNAQWSDYLNGQNNSLAMQMGRMQQGSAAAAGNQATTGAMIGAGGAIIGGVAIAF